jgi:hypothetical protein
MRTKEELAKAYDAVLKASEGYTTKGIAEMMALTMITLQVEEGSPEEAMVNEFIEEYADHGYAKVMSFMQLAMSIMEDDQ